MFMRLISTIIFIILFSTPLLAELQKPTPDIVPEEVVKIQLTSLMNNNQPYANAGIDQTWEFAHPNNQKNTGPLNRFIKMLKGDSYKMLLNHKEHKITEVQLTDLIASYEVTILDENKSYHKFNWQVEKYTKDGTLKDCWLTTMVSAPIPLGSSI